MNFKAMEKRRSDFEEQLMDLDRDIELEDVLKKAVATEQTAYQEQYQQIDDQVTQASEKIAVAEERVDDVVNRVNEHITSTEKAKEDLVKTETRSVDVSIKLDEAKRSASGMHAELDSLAKKLAACKLAVSERSPIPQTTKAVNTMTVDVINGIRERSIEVQQGRSFLAELSRRGKRILERRAACDAVEAHIIAQRNHCRELEEELAFERNRKTEVEERRRACLERLDELAASREACAVRRAALDLDLEDAKAAAQEAKANREIASDKAEKLARKTEEAAAVLEAHKREVAMRKEEYNALLVKIAELESERDFKLQMKNKTKEDRDRELATLQEEETARQEEVMALRKMVEEKEKKFELWAELKQLNAVHQVRLAENENLSKKRQMLAANIEHATRTLSAKQELLKTLKSKNDELLMAEQKRKAVAAAASKKAERMQKLELEKAERVQKLELEKAERMQKLELEKAERMKKLELEKAEGMKKLELEKAERMKKLELEEAERMKKLELEEVAMKTARKVAQKEEKVTSTAKTRGRKPSKKKGRASATVRKEEKVKVAVERKESQGRKESDEWRETDVMEGAEGGGDGVAEGSNEHPAKGKGTRRSSEERKSKKPPEEEHKHAPSRSVGLRRQRPSPSKPQSQPIALTKGDAQRKKCAVRLFEEVEPEEPKRKSEAVANDPGRRPSPKRSNAFMGGLFLQSHFGNFADSENETMSSLVFDAEQLTTSTPVAAKKQQRNDMMEFAQSCLRNSSSAQPPKNVKRSNSKGTKERGGTANTREAPEKFDVYDLDFDSD